MMKKVYLLLLGVLCLSIQSFAQRTVTGKVTDDQGLPLANVSVTLKGTRTGTTTRTCYWHQFYDRCVFAKN